MADKKPRTKAQILASARGMLRPPSAAPSYGNTGTLSPAGKAFIYDREGGWQENPHYPIRGDKLTIGIGHTGKDVNFASQWSEEFANDVFRKDIDTRVSRIAEGLPRSVPQRYFDLAVDIAFNVGPEAWNKSKARQALIDGDYEKFAYEFGDRDQGFVKQTNPETEKKEFVLGLYNRRQSGLTRNHKATDEEYQQLNNDILAEQLRKSFEND